MNSGNAKFEHDFEAFLHDDDSRLAALYRKLPQAEPNAQLDAAVRAMAHRAVAISAREPTRGFRWLPVLATAATIVLAAGIAIRMSPRMGATRQSIPATARDEGTRARGTMLPAPPAVSNAPRAASAPALQSLRAPTAAKPTPTSLAPAAPTAAALASKPVGSGTTKAEKTASKELRARTPQAFPAAPTTLTAAKKTQRAAGTLAGGRAAQEQGTPAVAADAFGNPATAPPYSAELMRNSRLYPESWIEAIRRLIQAGRDEQARQNLDYFRKKYPDYHLPADLDQFARQPQ